jgi:hypothetical protein
MGLSDKTRIDLIQKAHQYCLDNVPDTPVPLCVMKRLKETTPKQSAFSNVVHRIQDVFKPHADR